jgi:asparagine synthase (glutamine-hydrolysing)
VGLGRLTAREGRPYKDYSRWFRTILRPWVEDTLLDHRTLERGYFRPDFIRRLVAEHAGGADHAVRIGALLTLELWHRQFAD